MTQNRFTRLKSKLWSKETLGAFMVFMSAICFYLMSVAIKLAGHETRIDAVFFLLARCAASFVVTAGLFLIRGKIPRPKNVWLVAARAFFYIAAVFCFYIAIEKTTTAQANILHMTYPLYIALFSFLFFKGKKDYPGYVMTIAAIIGIWLIVSPGGFNFQIETLWGVGAGLFGAIAVMCLNLARKYDDADTILFYMFGFGAIILYILFPDRFHIPNLIELKYLVVVTLFGGFGQYALTSGFKFVSAVEGGVISSVRILLAALLGPILVADPALTIGGWIGALLIFGANVYLTLRKVSIGGTAEESAGKIGTMV